MKEDFQKSHEKIRKASDTVIHIGWEFSENVSNSWIDDFNKECSEMDTMEKLYPYYSKITDLLYDGNFEEVDLFFETTCVSTYSNVLLTGIPRITSSCRHYLRGWEMLLERCANEFERRGIDSKQKLKGLL